MTDVLTFVTTADAGQSNRYPTTDSSAWAGAICPRCGASQMFVIARQVRPMDGGSSFGRESLATLWLRCPVCYTGAVRQDEVLHPTTRPLRTPRGLPEADEAAWSEVRSCLGVGANVAAVMLCRKLLLHIAVAHGLPAKDSRKRAPGFAEAIKYLQQEGLVTPPMKKWVDRIKDVGNEANHELKPIEPDVALDVATFTEQLLVLAYEMSALMGEAAPEYGDDDEDTSELGEPED